MPQFEPFGGGSYAWLPGTVEVTITWCSDDPIVAGTRSITLNGASVTGSFTYEALGGTMPCFDAGVARGRSVGTVALQEGVNSVLGYICTSTVCGSDSVTYTRLPPSDPVPVQSVRVSPDSLSVSSAAFAVDTQRFVVKSLATSTMTFLLDATCDRRAARSCTLSQSSVTLAPANSAFVDLVYTTGPVGATGPLRLRARHDSVAHDQDDGSALLTASAGTPSATRVRVSEAQHATAIAKDLCLTVALTRETALSCGDLRIVHPLPAVAVRNQLRQPTLLYDSRTASGTALLAATVTMPSGATPSRVTATLSVRDTAGSWSTATTGDWAGAAFTPGVAVRVALAWEMAGGSGTRLVPYRLDVTPWDGGTPRAMLRDSGSFALVDRSTSPFGAGWWLAGLERLYSAKGASPVPADTSLLWVGGDGSTRRFRRVATNTWVGDTVDVPDTLRYVSDSSWFERRLSGGTRVRFDTGGRHTQTVDRLGIRTAFVYDGSGRLSRIVPAGLSDTTHFFEYSGTTQVHVCAQGSCSSGTTRRDTVVLSSGRVDRINGVGGLVDFTFDGLRRITQRIDRRETPTRFSYVGRAGLVDTVTTTNTSGSVTFRRWRFAHGNGAGLGSPSAQTSAVPWLSAATQMDGPRNDVADTTRVWLDAFGAPLQVRDALGHTTTLSRGDRTFPALATGSRAANGFTTWAMYDSRGNLIVQGAKSPYADSRSPWTTYEWNTKWDFVTRTTNPAGDWVGAAYDSSTGNRTESFGIRGDTTRFTYVGGSGIDRGLMSEVQQPYGITETYRYDARGNLDTLIAPDGSITAIFRDALGRDTLRVSPIDSSRTERVRSTYDGRDRVVELQRTGPAMNYALRSYPSVTVPVPPETLTVTHVYDAESNLTSTSTDGTGDFFASVTESNVYDLGNAVVERTSAGATTAITRDAAGNPTATLFPGETQAVTAAFDALNREVQRVTPEKVHASSTCGGFGTGPLNDFTCEMLFPLFPNHTGGAYRVVADTATISYDANGNRLTASNGTVALRWSYFPGGATKTDSTGSAGFRLAYDWNGRRASVAVGSDSLRYHYHTYGALRRITLPGQGFFRFTHDLLLRIDSMVVRPPASTGGLTETRQYDVNSRLFVRRRTSVPLGILTLDTLWYDRRDRMLDVRAASQASGPAERITFSYSGLGSLVAQERTRSGGGEIIEQFTTDAAGAVGENRIRSLAAPLDSGWFESLFDGTGAMVSRSYTASPPSPQWIPGRLYSDETTQQVEASGRVARSGRVEERIGLTGNPPTPIVEYSLQEATRNFFGADGKLAATQRYVWKPSGLAGTWEQYRYDALGRRHLVIVKRDSAALCEATAAWCDSYTETTVWDGDAAFQESRGVTRRYVPGLQLDQPLALWDGRVFNPSWRGALESSVWMNGTAADQSLGGSSGTIVDWAQKRGVYWQPGPGPVDPLPPDYTWIGNAATGFLQTTGQLYRRNRQYDPLSGQFTQQDPIGLAGGANLYGFAAGDPANFSDPFGLCVFGIKWCPPRDWHYARARLNGPAPTFDEVVAPQSGWTEASAFSSVWHRQGAGNEGHRKFVHLDGREFVFSADRRLVSDPLNRGTFNFGSDPLTHSFLDVFPYLLWGNAPDDPSTAPGRTFFEPTKFIWDEINRLISDVQAAGGTVVVRP